MGNFKIRYLVAKNRGGRLIYYWQPKQAYVKLGWGARRIAQKTNLLEDAITEAEKLNAELDAWRKQGDTTVRVEEGSVEWLVAKYQQSEWYKQLRGSTQIGYDHWAKKITKWGRGVPFTKLSKKACKEFYAKLQETSLHNANGALRFLRVLFSFAIDEGLCTDNPAKGIRLVGTKARQQVWSPEDVQIIIAKSLEMGRASVAVAVKLAENLGQRQGDILAMKWEQYNGQAIRLKQSKTGAFIEVKCSEDLKRWLDKDRKESGYIVVSETTGTRYMGNNFQNIFGEIRAKTEIGNFWFMDLRRTAVVRLAEAGCTVPEIAAITGHSIETCQKILEVYLPRNAVMAANAIDKLERHRAAKNDQ